MMYRLSLQCNQENLSMTYQSKRAIVIPGYAAETQWLFCICLIGLKTLIFWRGRVGIEPTRDATNATHRF